MKMRNEAIDAARCILETSCAADGCWGSDALRGIAEAIVDAVTLTEAGESVQAAVDSFWELDDFERKQLFGDGSS